MPVKKVNLFLGAKTLYRINTLSGKLHDFGSALPWSQYPISLVSHLPSPVSFHMQMTPGRTDADLMARLGNLDLSHSPSLSEGKEHSYAQSGISGGLHGSAEEEKGVA